MKNIYEYDVTDFCVVDGDIVCITIDMGCEIDHSMTVRLIGVEAPSSRTPDGDIAKHALHALLTAGEVSCQTYRTKRGWEAKGNRGRYLARFFVTKYGDTVDINNEMIASGLAIPYE